MSYSYNVDRVFVDICKMGNVRKFERYLEKGDANRETFRHGLQVAILHSNVEITKRLIDRGATSEDMLILAVITLYRNLRDEIHQSTSYTRRMKKYALKIMHFILDNCQIDTKWVLNDLDYPGPVIENKSSIQAKKIIQDILDEYTFRLDGPVYNANIIA